MLVGSGSTNTGSSHGDARPIAGTYGSDLGSADDSVQVDVHPRVAVQHPPIVSFAVLQLDQLRCDVRRSNQKQQRAGKRWVWLCLLTTGFCCAVFNSVSGSIALVVRSVMHTRHSSNVRR
jgi:hypothetical protein